MEKSKKSNETLKRIGIAVIFVPLVAFSLFNDWLDKGIIFVCLTSWISFLGSSEILGFGKAKDIKINSIVSGIVSICLPVIAYLACNLRMFNFFYATMILLTSATMFIFLKNVITRNIDHVVESVSLNIFSFLYPSFFLSLLVVMKYDYNPWYPVYLFVISWCGDSGAYFAGRYLGKTKMNLKASPNKTLEGYIGGFVSAILSALLVSRVISPLHMPNAFSGIIFDNILLEILFISVLSFVSFSGDLLESSFKRDSGKKDSDKMFRFSTHGGALDVIDSVSLVTPVAYLIIHLTGLI